MRIRLHSCLPIHRISNPLVTMGRRPLTIPRNRIFPYVRRFIEAVFSFYNDTFFREWKPITDAVTEKFQVITHGEYRAIAWYEFNGG